MKSKRSLLDLARSLTCYKHDNFNIPEQYIMTSEEKIVYEHSKVQERILEKKVKRSVGWNKFDYVFMVSASLNHGTSDIKVSYLNYYVITIKFVYIMIFKIYLNIN